MKPILPHLIGWEVCGQGQVVGKAANLVHTDCTRGYCMFNATPCGLTVVNPSPGTIIRSSPPVDNASSRGSSSAQKNINLKLATGYKVLKLKGGGARENRRKEKRGMGMKKEGEDRIWEERIGRRSC